MIFFVGSAGRMSPNIIVKDPEIGKRTVTLTLSNVPLTDAVECVARVRGPHGRRKGRL